ncbi:hypothetical protein ARAM_004694 [Aspergillus rambellii]|uniref:5'-3' exoribonuclease n=2 Tax=Aspergillus subgen. Nidulantes TaxID=2720870 RepID=A0A0F8V4H5_9EURO|nr:hypothetical protein AOCH_001744 [Aspergillus ochraceoroseus]KKK26669.1 hypothetical protein ARAM_004694 [Aspergillus rambellii]
MGVPALFRWLSNKYPKIISPVIEEFPEVVNGEEIPVNTTGPNPNGEETDNLYLDMNGIVHPCTHPEGRPPPANEQEMMLEIFKYTDRVVNMVRPRKLLMIALDGVAPRAKMNQQRARRFRSAQEAREADEKKEEFRKMLAKQNGNKDRGLEEEVIKKTWDSNVITPGTPFMDILAASLRYWIAYKLNTDPAWEKLKIIISDATVPGEGEHKIMEFVRSQRASPEHDPNTRHVMYGLDADLIMLGLATHEPYFKVLREDVFFQESKPRTCNLCGQQGHKAEECRGQAKEKNGEFDEKGKGTALKPFIWLHVSILREYLAVELSVPQQPFPFDLERALDDWVFMCFFVGNDFLPHLPSLDIRENGIDTLIAIWRDNIPVMGGYLTQDGHVDLKRAQLILQGLAKQEDAIFRRRRQAEERKLANEKRRKQEEKARNEERARKRRRSSPNYEAHDAPATPKPRGPGANTAPPADLELITPGRGQLARQTRELTHSMVVNRGAVYRANMANKSAAAVLKSKLMKGSQDDQPLEESEEPTPDPSEDKPGETSPSVLGKRKADETPGEETGTETPSKAEPKKDDELPPDTVRLWEEGYADRYYEQKFGVDPQDKEFRHKVARAYAEGLAWVLLYYFQGCPSWNWYYPYHYAPFAADFVDIADMDLSFEKGTPFKPFEQLMGVLPASSNHAIPEIFHDLMSDPKSEIIDFYPEDFAVDLNGKKFAWQGVVLLPFIDEKRLLTAMHKKYPLLSDEEKMRNEIGRDVLLLSESHPLYQDLVGNFYSKKQGAPKYKLNMRLSEGLAGKVERNESYIPHSSLVSSLEEYGMPTLEDDRSLMVDYEIPKSVHTHKSMLLRGVKFAPPALDNADIQATKHRSQNSGRSFGGAPFRNNRGGRINYASNDRPNPFAAHLDPKFVPAGNAGPPMGAPSGWIPPSGSNNFSRGPPPPPRGGMSHSYNSQQYGSYNSGQGQRGSYQQSSYNHGEYYNRGSQGSYNNGQGDYYQGRSSNYGSQESRGGGYHRGGYQGRDSRNSGGYGRY